MYVIRMSWEYGNAELVSREPPWVRLPVALEAGNW